MYRSARGGGTYARLHLVHLFYDWAWAGQPNATCARAIDLESRPSDHASPGGALPQRRAARIDEAIAEVLQSQELDPLSPVVKANVGWTFYLAGRHDAGQ